MSDFEDQDCDDGWIYLPPDELAELQAQYNRLRSHLIERLISAPSPRML